MTEMRVVFFAMLALLLAGICCKGAEVREDASSLPRRVLIQTEFGDIEVELFTDEAPKTCANFIRLVKDHFYNDLTFFRVVKGMLIETGCPRGDGTGGPGWTIPLEITSHKHIPGAVVMDRKRGKPGSHGSQFYICCGKLPERDGNYCVFGRVVRGMDVVRKIENVEVEYYVIGGEPFHTPKKPIKVICIKVIEEPKR